MSSSVSCPSCLDGASLVPHVRGTLQSTGKPMVGEITQDIGSWTKAYTIPKGVDIGLWSRSTHKIYASSKRESIKLFIVQGTARLQNLVVEKFWGGACARSRATVPATPIPGGTLRHVWCEVSKDRMMCPQGHIMMQGARVPTRWECVPAPMPRPRCTPEDLLLPARRAT